MNIPHFDAPVKTGGEDAFTYTPELSVQFVMRTRYTIPGVVHPDGRLKILLGVDPIIHLGRNIRSSDAVLYTNGTLNIRCDILERAIGDKLRFIEIVIEYRRTGTRKTFAASVETILTHAEKIYMDGCWQWALPKHFWLCDGQPQPQPKQPKPQPEAEQGLLFDLPADRKVGAY